MIMKRALSRDYDYNEFYMRPDSGLETPYLSQCDIKRARSGSPSRIIGPLLFNDSGTELERALIAVEPSSLPGVHRMAPLSSSLVQLWAPHMPATQFLQVDVSELLYSIDGKCIFVFDSRARQTDQSIFTSDKASFLLQSKAIRRYGLLVSVFPPPIMGQESIQAHIPVVQDPDGILGTLCNFSSYLGPSAVLVKNSEVKATCMLSRSPEAIDRALSEWLNV